VTIEVQMDFTPDLAEGPFEVTEGADVLGCTDGTSVDAENDNPAGITKVFTCESGPSAGTFSMLFFPEPDPVGPADESGPWSVTTGVEDFVGLQGDGDMSVTLDSDTTGTATFTGTVEFGP
jgi:hypothetical protein